MKYLLISFSLLGFILFACKKDKVSVLACSDNVSYSADIYPLIMSNCSTSGCHDATSAASGYDLTNYTSISSNANIILQVLNHEPGVTAMPFGQPKLVDSIIAKVECWVANGSIEN